MNSHQTLRALLCIALLSLLATRSTAQLVSFNAISPTNGADSYKMYDESQALLIGFPKYQDSSWDPLETVPNEIESIRKALIAQGFNDNKIKIVVDHKGSMTGERLGQLVRNFVVQSVHRDTRMVMYFAGHGWTDGQFTGYLVPPTSPAQSSPKFREGLVSMSEIVDWSRQSKAKHMLFVFDSCFSGAVFLTRSNLQPPHQLFLADADRPVRQFLTSGSATDSVPAKSDFADKLVEGLGGAADTDLDGVVTVNELGYWIKSNITRLGKQTPQYGTSPYSEFRYGDTLFKRLNSSADPLKMPVVHRSGEQRGTRGSNESAFGKPDRDALAIFRGLEVIYYEKIGDEGAVEAAMNQAMLPFNKTRASRPQGERTNAIACSPTVPIDAIRALALTLVRKGITLNAIFPYSNPKLKPQRLEILTTPLRSGPGLRSWKDGGITEEDILNLRACS